MGLFEDIHLLICLIALLYLFRKVKESTQSRMLGITVAGFVVFFIFFQHVWIAFIFFFVMFGYLFVGGLTQGVVEGSMTRAYMGFLRNPPQGMAYAPLQMPHPGTGWFG